MFRVSFVRRISYFVFGVLELFKEVKGYRGGRFFVVDVSRVLGFTRVFE